MRRGKPEAAVLSRGTRRVPHHVCPGEVTHHEAGYAVRVPIGAVALGEDRIALVLLPVFIDGRTDLYALNGTVLDEYSQVHWIRPGWEEILDRYDTGFVVTEHTGLLDTMLGERPGWSVIHRDDLAVIYHRTRSIP